MSQLQISEGGGGKQGFKIWIPRILNSYNRRTVGKDAGVRGPHTIWGFWEHHTNWASVKLYQPNSKLFYPHPFSKAEEQYVCVAVSG